LSRGSILRSKQTERSFKKKISIKMSLAGVKAEPEEAVFEDVKIKKDQDEIKLKTDKNEDDNLLMEFDFPKSETSISKSCLFDFMLLKCF
jgi:hypothetical protein